MAKRTVYLRLQARRECYDEALRRASMPKCADYDPLFRNCETRVSCSLVWFIMAHNEDW